MNYTETTTTSYWIRVWNSLKGMIFGFFLIIWMVYLLWWNEQRTINVTQGLQEAQEITVNWKTEKIDDSLEWKVVYNTWDVISDIVHKDEVFWIEKNALKMIRKVEMYQWQEKEKNETQDNMWGSQTTTTTYTYHSDWYDTKINSQNFKQNWYTNPSNWLYQNKSFISDDIRIWKLFLSADFIYQLNRQESIVLSQWDFEYIQKNLSNTEIVLENNYLFQWKWNMNSPEIWDIRISFYSVNPNTVSVIWKQAWTQLVPYITSTETNVSLLEYWKKTIEQMYQTAHDNNMFLAWILRFIGLIWIFIWFRLIFGIFDAIAKFIPMLWSIIWFWTGIISFLLAIILWGSTIAIAWLYVRPLVWWTILLVVALIIAMVIKMKKSKLWNKQENQLGYIEK